MKEDRFFINKTPVLLLGEQTDYLFIFIHGQNGNKEESFLFADICIAKGWQVLGVDLPEHGQRSDNAKFLPCDVISELHQIYNYVKSHWSHISVRANSIGAWFIMLAFKNAPFEKCLFVSPVLDMERLIFDMMKWANVNEKDLEMKKEIKTDFGQTLSWDYLCYVRQNIIEKWTAPTEILYAGGDMMISRETINCFVKKNGCGLTIMENGEHWFHTKEQVDFMKNWEEKILSCKCIK